MAFCTASRQQKYTAASSSAGSRGTSIEVMSTGIGPDATAARSAATGPASVSSRG